MKYYTSLVELWILEHFFQRFSDLSFKYLKLTNFFWAVVCSIVSFLSYAYLSVKGILAHEYMVILCALPMFGVFIPATIYSIKKARLHAYDHATWGVENPLKVDDAAVRRGAFEMVLISFAMWLLISIKHGNYPVSILIWWVTIVNYPTLCFCACNPPGRRF